VGITLRFNDQSDIPDLEIDSISWGAEHALPAGAGARQAQAFDVRLTRVVDRWSSFLSRAAVTGTTLGTVTLIISKESSQVAASYITIVLTGVMIPSLSATTGGGKPRESFSFVFDTVSYMMGRPADDGDD
jgi:type VI protein secretion system component Hcp